MGCQSPTFSPLSLILGTSIVLLIEKGVGKYPEYVIALNRNPRRLPLLIIYLSTPVAFDVVSFLDLAKSFYVSTYMDRPTGSLSITHCASLFLSEW